MRGGRSIALVLSLLVAPVMARAQDPAAKFEAGGQIAALTLRSGARPGAGVWFDVNFSRPLAIEGRATWLTDGSAFSAVHVAAGVRATFVRTPRLSFFGVALPGWYRVAYEGASRTDNAFALDLGAGLTVRATHHLIARVELDRIIIASPGETVTEGFVGMRGQPPIIRSVKLPGFVGSNWDLRAGLSYAFGSSLVRPTGGAARQGRWTIGPQLGYTIASSAVGMSAAGAFVSYRLAAHVDLDGSVSAFIHGDLQPTLEEGGRMTQALAGVKVGVREGRVGVFFKLRAGVNSFAHVFVPPRTVSRSTVPALDLGGVIEVNVSPSTFIRGDVGESLSFERIDRLALVGEIFAAGDQSALYTLPLRVGFGWRF